tara:strand:- start:577 stop:711 length:135 start_codon:yes stop_codon:yes gene_type:complete
MRDVHVRASFGVQQLHVQQPRAVCDVARTIPGEELQHHVRDERW